MIRPHAHGAPSVNMFCGELPLVAAGFLRLDDGQGRGMMPAVYNAWGRKGFGGARLHGMPGHAGAAKPPAQNPPPGVRRLLRNRGGLKRTTKIALSRS